MSKSLDTNMMFYLNSMSFAKESAQSYLIFARNCKRRGDVSGWMDNWYKLQYHRMVMRHWQRVMREYPRKLRELQR